jgi:hypothetical protein
MFYRFGGKWMGEMDNHAFFPNAVLLIDDSFCQIYFKFGSRIKYPQKAQKAQKG